MLLLNKENSCLIDSNNKKEVLKVYCFLIIAALFINTLRLDPYKVKIGS